MKRVCIQDWGMVKAHFEIEGVHAFAGVEEMMARQDEEEPKIEIPFLDVSFLKYPHRHIFHFNIKVEVSHDDRDIEFIQLARMLREAMKTRYPVGQYGCSDFGNRSCEMLGHDVVQLFLAMFPSYTGIVLIEVSEDGENSSISKYNIETEEDNDTV